MSWLNEHNEPDPRAMTPPKDTTVVAVLRNEAGEVLASLTLERWLEMNAPDKKLIFRDVGDLG